jgi:hypothetical protein
MPNLPLGVSALRHSVCDIPLCWEVLNWHNAVMGAEMQAERLGFNVVAAQHLTPAFPLLSISPTRAAYLEWGCSAMAVDSLS